MNDLVISMYLAALSFVSQQSYEQQKLSASDLQNNAIETVKTKETSTEQTIEIKVYPISSINTEQEGIVVRTFTSKKEIPNTGAEKIQLNNNTENEQPARKARRARKTNSRKNVKR